MRVGITGCAGFLGSHLTDALLSRGHYVVGVDNLSMGKIENVQHNFEKPEFEFYKEDVRNLTALQNMFHDVDVIVHLAAYKIPRYGNSIKTLLINSEGTHNVLEVARMFNAKAVIASTSDVYGKNPELPFSEESNLVLGPSTVRRWSYAVSKLFDEHLAFAYQEEYDIPVVLLRFFGSYGPRHHLSWWGGPQSVFITQVLEDEPITIHGDGQQTRSFTFVSDTINGIVRSVEMEQANGHVFNLGSTHEITIIELARLIHELADTGRPMKVKYVSYNSFNGKKYEDVNRRVPDISKAKRLLGFVPRVDLRMGLKLTINWQRRVMEQAKQKSQAMYFGKQVAVAG